MSRLVYLDQNAWVTLAKGSWDKERYPQEHSALTRVVGMVRSGSISIPLSFANIYETSKVNVPHRRANLARTQSLVSGGLVFCGRRRILAETLAAYIADRCAISRPAPPTRWFLSDLWFEAVGDYSPESYGFVMPERLLSFIRQDPGRALFDYLVFQDEAVRLEAVRRYSAGSADLISRLEARRALVAGERVALRKRAYGARLVMDELDFIFATSRDLGLDWSTIADIGSSLVRGMVTDVPILNVERELVVRLEGQGRAISENDLRDMIAFITVLPLADVVVAEKQFVNLARQAHLDERHETTLLTSIHDL
ncbi:MAG: hypothetical protein ACK4SZ_06730 [Allosphingosinicella sp.]|uniref:hypothetical protein n=1 Tax=Allosphingosinicella sp. TaxID=2823234 RepID=UPI00393AF2CF